MSVNPIARNAMVRQLEATEEPEVANTLLEWARENGDDEMVALGILKVASLGGTPAEALTPLLDTRSPGYHAMCRSLEDTSDPERARTIRDWADKNGASELLRAAEEKLAEPKAVATT